MPNIGTNPFADAVEGLGQGFQLGFGAAMDKRRAKLMEKDQAERHDIALQELDLRKQAALRETEAHRTQMAAKAQEIGQSADLHPLALKEASNKLALQDQTLQANSAELAASNAAGQAAELRGQLLADSTLENWAAAARGRPRLEYALENFRQVIDGARRIPGGMGEIENLMPSIVGLWEAQLHDQNVEDGMADLPMLESFGLSTQGVEAIKQKLQSADPQVQALGLSELAEGQRAAAQQHQVESARTFVTGSLAAFRTQVEERLVLSPNYQDLRRAAALRQLEFSAMRPSITREQLEELHIQAYKTITDPGEDPDVARAKKLGERNAELKLKIDAFQATKGQDEEDIASQAAGLQKAGILEAPPSDAGSGGPAQAPPAGLDAEGFGRWAKANGLTDPEAAFQAWKAYKAKGGK